MLSVQFMQQDKFKRAEECLDQTTEPSNAGQMMSPRVDSIKSPDKRRNSAAYWKNKFHQALGIIDELHEKSIVLSDIPDFMTVKKVKPKLSKESVRVTKIYGSMKAKNVIEVVKEIKDRKEKAAVKSKRPQRKRKSQGKHSCSAKSNVFARVRNVLQ